MHRKGLVIGILILMLSVNIGSTFAGDVDVKTMSSVGFDGNTLYVGGSGPNNYTTIQSAVDDAVNGDTVFVYDDSSPYYENLIVNTTINLKGEIRDTTIIDGDNKEDTIYLSADGITISGFTIKSGINGINVESQYNLISSNIIINNQNGVYIYRFSTNNFNTIINNKIESNSHKGITFYNTDNCNIINNTMRLNGDNEISTYGSSNNFISGNIIISDSGIFVNGGGNNTVSNNIVQSSSSAGIILLSPSSTVEGNIVSNCAETGIYIHTSSSTVKDNQLINNGFYPFRTSDNMVTNNTIDGKPLVYLVNISDTVFDGTAGQIILVSCNNVTIRNQEINSVDYGISLFNSHNCNICFNNVSSNRYYGIYLDDDSAHNNISHNLITGNSKGIYIWKAIDNIFYKNELFNNSIGIYFYRSYENTVRNNNIFNNNNGISISHSYISGLDIFENTIHSNLGNGISSLRSSNLDIFENTIHSNLGNGIRLEDFSNCHIYDNLIAENTIGVSLTQIERMHFSNYISSNNFIANNLHAEFHDTWPLFFPRSHIWSNNYWDDIDEEDKFMRIRGTFAYRYTRNLMGDITGVKTIRWRNYDWNPASEPYDIGV